MVKDIWQRTTQIRREEPRIRHYLGYHFRLPARVLFYMHHPTDRIAHTTVCVTMSTMSGRSTVKLRQDRNNTNASLHQN